MKAFAADHDKFVAQRAQILGVSRDDTKTNRRFRLHCVAPFPFLSDEAGKTTKAYGLESALTGWARRTTYLIDETSIVRSVYAGMPDNAAILKDLAALPRVESTEKATSDVRKH
jgi:peroxiredoxin